MNIATKRLVAIGAFAVVAAAPAVAATMTTSTAPDRLAAPECLAWFGNKEDGKCLSYSNGTPVWVGTPQFNYCPGVNAGRDNCGIQTGPLLPGTTFQQGIGTP